MVSPSALCTLSVLLFSSFSFAFPQLSKRATISPDGTCGGSKGYTCQGSNYGNSCSKNNQCGRDVSYSELSKGCQPAYGFCYAKGSVSPDGSCGGSDMFICIGSNFGDSCGPNNLCGRDAGYSGTGCQPQYGYCAQCTTSAQPSTTVVTSTTTTTRPVTQSGSTTITVTSGIASTTTTTTTTSVSTTVTTNTVTPSPIVTSTTTTTTTTVSSGTLTVSYTSSVVFQKRDTVLPALPLKIGAATTTPYSNGTTPAARLLARATALSCGTVVTTGYTTTTSTTTMTATAFSTTTTIAKSYTTVPSTTTTFTSVSTSVTTTTSTTMTTVPASTITSTVTTVSTVVVPAATTNVGLPGPIYSKAYERTDTNSCFYSGSFYQQIGVSGDPTNNYQAGVTGCAAACSGDSTCKSFYFSSSTDPSGKPSYYCLLDKSPYAPGSVTCDYQTTTNYLVDYNKVQ